MNKTIYKIVRITDNPNVFKSAIVEGKASLEYRLKVTTHAKEGMMGIFVVDDLRKAITMMRDYEELNHIRLRVLHGTTRSVLKFAGRIASLSSKNSLDWSRKSSSISQTVRDFTPTGIE